MGNFFSALSGFGQAAGNYAAQGRDIASKEKMHHETSLLTEARQNEEKRQNDMTRWQQAQSHLGDLLHNHLTNAVIGSGSYLEGNKLLSKLWGMAPGDPGAGELAQKIFEHTNVHPDTMALLNPKPKEPQGTPGPAGPGQTPGGKFVIPPIGGQQSQDSNDDPMAAMMSQAPTQPSSDTSRLAPVAGFPDLPGAPAPPPVPPGSMSYAGHGSWKPQNPIQTAQSAAQPGSSPIQGGAPIQIPAVGGAPPQPQPMPAQATPSPESDMYNNAMADFHQSGVMSPGMAHLISPIYQKHAENDYNLNVIGPQKLQAVAKVYGGLDKVPPHVMEQLALESAGMQYHPQPASTFIPHMIAGQVMGKDLPPGTADVYGNPTAPGTMYRKVMMPGQTQPVFEPIAPQTGTAATTDGGVNVFNKKTGASIAPVQGAVTPGMQPRQKSSTSYTDEQGLQHTSGQSTVGGVQGGIPGVSGATPPLMGGIINKHAEGLVKGTNAEIDKAAKPTVDLMARTSRFNESLNTPTGISTAVAVPEFLTIMAGGAGSGLRMTDTELNRIFAGTSKAGELRQIVQKWASGEKNYPGQLTPTQVGQMKDLVNKVNQKAIWKSDLFNAARDMTKDMTLQPQHRAVMNFMNRELVKIDQSDTGVYKPFNWKDQGATEGLKAHLLSK